MIATGLLRGLLRQQLWGAGEQQLASANSSLSSLRWFAAAPNQMALIKQLREQTGAPISDVKSALQQADWDLENAAQELRKKGVAAASKKASRHAAEGLVGLASGPSAVAIIEINSETDFVARNDQFRNLVSRVAASALQLDHTTGGNVPLTTLEAGAIDGASSVAAAVADVAGSVRENINLRRGLRLALPSGTSGVLGTYLHASVGPGLGRIASVVMLESSSDVANLSAEHTKYMQDLAHKLAMHVVGAVPQYLDAAAVPGAALDAERALLREQAARSGKPEAIVARMVEGRLNKFYEEVCLLEQPFIMDDKKKIKQVVEEAGKKAGTELRLTSFVRVQVGEGLENEGKKDFAEEVAELL